MRRSAIHDARQTRKRAISIFCLNSSLLAAFTTTEHVILRYATILKDQFGSLGSTQAHLLFNAPGDQAGCPFRYDKWTNTFPTQALINRSEGHDQIGTCTISDVVFMAIDDPLVTIQDGGGRHTRHVGANPRFR